MRIEAAGIVCDTTLRPPSERVAFFTGLARSAAGVLFCTFQLGPTKHAASARLMLYRSRDQGASWQEVPFRFPAVFGGVPGGFSSGQIAEVEPGKLMLIATWYDRSDPKRQLFDPVTGGLLVSKQLRAFSTDEGQTWSAWEELLTPGAKGCSSTGPIVQWPNGLIAYPFESLKEFDDPNPSVHGAWCLLSTDRGRTFGPPVLVARDPANEIDYWDQRLCAAGDQGEFIALFWTHDRKSKQDLSVHLRKGSLGGNGLARTPVVPTGIPGQIAAPLLLDDGRLLAFVVDRGTPSTMTLWASRDGGATWPERLVIYSHDERAAISQGATNIDYVQYWEDMGKWSFGHPAIRSLGGGKAMLIYYAGAPDCMSIHWARVEVQN